jgi:heme-degrading monooxygenase HmoA
MFAVLFEVNPKPERSNTYLGYAKMLRPELEQVDGFIDNERFASLRRPGWILSLSTWRDEKALIRWRTAARHHEVQLRGRNEVFRDYHIRIGEIIFDNQLPADEPLEQQRFDETHAPAKFVSLSEAALHDLSPKPDPATVGSRLGAPSQRANSGLVEWDAFESIHHAGKFLCLTSWRYPADAARGVANDIRHRAIRVIRDYGMFDRAEAPQYYPPVP